MNGSSGLESSTVLNPGPSYNGSALADWNLRWEQRASSAGRRCVLGGFTGCERLSASRATTATTTSKPFIFNPPEIATL
jgi:hypothetical protein